jgi:G:T-mismatch repair DNA endonuclease (very short patch repair protein)
MDDYRQKFHSSMVQRMTIEQKTAIANEMRKKLDNDDELVKFLEWRSYPSELKHWTRKGLSDEEAATKQSEWQSNAGLRQNDHLETLEHRSREMTDDRNHMSLRSIADKYNVSLEEAQKLTPCYGRTGDKHPMFGKNHTEEAIAKISASDHIANPDYRSKPERELEERCRKIADLNTNVPLGRYNVDVLFSNKKLIVEMFGDYWHMNPIVYSVDALNVFMEKTAQQIWDRDARKLEMLRSLGYDVVVVWERDWRFKKEKIMKEIVDAYHRVR